MRSDGTIQAVSPPNSVFTCRRTYPSPHAPSKHCNDIQYPPASEALVTTASHSTASAQKTPPLIACSTRWPARSAVPPPRRPQLSGITRAVISDIATDPHHVSLHGTRAYPMHLPAAFARRVPRPAVRTYRAPVLGITAVAGDRAPRTRTANAPSNIDSDCLVHGSDVAAADGTEISDTGSRSTVVDTPTIPLTS